MRKCDKKKLEKVRYHERVAACRRRVIRKGKELGITEEMVVVPVELIVQLVQSLPTKYLQVIANISITASHQIEDKELARLSIDELQLRAMKVE
jgi:hypothetical protein